MELSRIGSDFLRPDIQVRGLVVEQVYHLELGKNLWIRGLLQSSVSSVVEF